MPQKISCSLWLCGITCQKNNLFTVNGRRWNSLSLSNKSQTMSYGTLLWGKFAWRQYSGLVTIAWTASAAKSFSHIAWVEFPCESHFLAWSKMSGCGIISLVVRNRAPLRKDFWLFRWAWNASKALFMPRVSVRAESDVLNQQRIGFLNLLGGSFLEHQHPWTCVITTALISLNIHVLIFFIKIKKTTKETVLNLQLFLLSSAHSSVSFPRQLWTSICYHCFPVSFTGFHWRIRVCMPADRKTSYFSQIPLETWEAKRTTPNTIPGERSRGEISFSFL